MRARYFRRLALLAGLLLASAVTGGLTLLRVAAARLGLAPSDHPALTAVLLGAAGIAMIAVLVTLGRTLRHTGGPLRAVMDAADQVADGNYEVRVNEGGPPPIRALARAFNTMTSRLQQHDRQRRDLMADVAHELRTPLTVMQGRLEGMIDGVYPLDADHLSLALDETRLLARLVDDLRTLALSESGTLKLEREPADVAALAREAAMAFAAPAAAHGVSLEVVAAEPMPSLEVDPVRIRQVLGNLLANALGHTPSGGSIVVRADRSPDAVVLQVADTGSGMTAAELEHAFDRFQKGPDSRGAGLGLAIARGLVAAHGGEMRATSEPGRGTTMIVTLPTGTEAVSASS
jgi:two-component system OmpR family sensor kinase/two-component system sensor histidine kinase BaeS